MTPPIEIMKLGMKVRGETTLDKTPSITTTKAPRVKGIGIILLDILFSSSSKHVSAVHDWHPFVQATHIVPSR